MGLFFVIGEVEGVLIRVGRWSEAYETQVCHFERKFYFDCDWLVIYTSLCERFGLDVGSEVDRYKEAEEVPVPLVS